MRRSTWGMILAALCMVVWVVPVSAQPDDDRPGRGQGRGFGRGGFGRFDMTFVLLGNEKVQTELNVSEEQQEQITALQEESTENMPDFRQTFQDLGEDATEEEREAAMSEMREQMEAQQAESREKLNEILAADQLDRLRQIRWQVNGLRSLRDDDAIEALELTEEQQTEIADLLEQQDEARWELGFEASEEDRQAFNTEWNERIEGVLTEDQQENWTVLLGDTFEIDRGELFGGRGGGGRGGFGGGQGGPGGGGRPGGGRPQFEDNDDDQDDSEDNDESDDD